jgi:hypothetical protein
MTLFKRRGGAPWHRRLLAALCFWLVDRAWHHADRATRVGRHFNAIAYRLRGWPMIGTAEEWW